MPQGGEQNVVETVRAMLARGEVRLEDLQPQGFALRGEEERGPRVTGSKVKYPRTLAEYAAEWGCDERTLKRFVKLGRTAEPMDLPPFHQVEKLASWYARYHKNRVPDWILRLGAKAETAAPASAVVPTGEVIDLREVDLEEGEAVKQARRLVGAAYEALERAYKGIGGNVDLLQAKYFKALEGLRKVEASEREWAKKRGEWILRAKVERDIATATEMLRQMRESMRRRVLELCASLSAEQREEVGAAILRVREQEDRVFRGLESLKKPSDVVELLAA